MKLRPRNVSVTHAVCFQVAPDRGDHGLVVPCVLRRGLKGRMWRVIRLRIYGGSKVMALFAREILWLFLSNINRNNVKRVM